MHTMQPGFNWPFHPRFSRSAMLAAITGLLVTLLLLILADSTHDLNFSRSTSPSPSQGSSVLPSRGDDAVGIAGTRWHFTDPSGLPARMLIAPTWSPGQMLT